jgi:hypothetical protein
MEGIWDTKTDAVKKGDQNRDVSPLLDKTWKDEEGFTHYVFSIRKFENPYYNIPEDDFQLYENYIEGGSRSYPSDGNIPCDVVAGEARKVLKKLIACSNDLGHTYCEDAQKALKNGKFAVLRGTLKLYLGKYTTRDWRRKRFTDDIDFWTFQVSLLDYTLNNCGFIKNRDGEFEKKVSWVNPDNKNNRNAILFAANNLNQLLDFGAGSYLQGSNLKEIFSKKIKRGHNVDLSDLINVAMVNNGIDGPHVEEWLNALSAFEEAANTRNTRTTANLISLCRYSFSIADHLDRVAQALNKYNDLIFDKIKTPDDKIKWFCRNSIHWEAFFRENGPEETRKMFHDFFHQEAEEKPIQAENLRNFAKHVLELLNSKYVYLKINFEIGHSS